MRVLILFSTMLSFSVSWAQPSFTVAYQDNLEGDFANLGWLEPESLFQTNIQAALHFWARHFESTTGLTVEVRAARHLSRSGGTFSVGRPIGRSKEGYTVHEPRPLTVMLTNQPSGFEGDLILLFNPQFVANNYWLDPTPLDREDEQVPLGKTDFVSIAMHELGHAFGMAGWRNFNEGENFGRLQGGASAYDLLTYFGGDGQPIDEAGRPNPLMFSGVHAWALLGSPMHLANRGPNASRASQNFYHLGDCGDDLLEHTLMRSCYVPTNGTRMAITPYDLVVLADLGYPLKELPVTFETRRLVHLTSREGGFHTQLIVTNSGHQTALLKLHLKAENGQGSEAMMVIIPAKGHTLLDQSNLPPNAAQLSFEGPSSIQLSALYRAAVPQATPTSVVASAAAGTCFHFSPGNPEVSFDGMAFINLGSSTLDVVAGLVTPAGEARMASTALSGIQPGAKGLLVLDAWATAARPGELIQLQTTELAQVLFLRGTHPGISPSVLYEVDPIPCSH